MNFRTYFRISKHLQSYEVVSFDRVQGKVFVYDFTVVEQLFKKDTFDTTFILEKVLLSVSSSKKLADKIFPRESRIKGFVFKKIAYMFSYILYIRLDSL